MSRVVVTAFVAASLFALSGYGAWLTWLSGEGLPLKARCGSWLAHPEKRWLALEGCALDVEDLVLESDAGELETLADRRAGLSKTLFEHPPRWVAAWAPVSAPGLRGRVGRVLYRLDAQDVVAWLNAFEGADAQRREAMWADPVALRRVAKPGVLAGEATAPATDALQKALGTRGAANLLTVLPGAPPPRTLPAWAVLALFGALGVSWLAWRWLGQLGRGVEPTAEQVITNAHVRDVDVGLGALEALRREEALRSRAPPGEGE